MPPPPAKAEEPLRPQRGAGPLRSDLAEGVAPIGFAVLLLVFGITSQGAFAISRWAPLALFALAVLMGVLAARGGLAVRSRAVRVALCGIWGLAAWSMLSMLWAQSSSDALTAADEMTLYAAIATLPFVLALSRRSLAWAGWAIAAGIGAIAFYVLFGMLTNGTALFLAGRLNGPVNYRNATALLFALAVWPLLVATATRTTRADLRAGAFALANLCLALVFLTQARGVLLGLAAGGCVVLVLGPDRVRRAWVAVLAFGGVAAASPWLLRPFHAFDGGRGAAAPHDIVVAARAAAVLAIASFVVAMAIALLENGLRADSAQLRFVRRAARVTLILCAVGALLASLAAVGDPAAFAHRKWDEFRSLDSTTPTTTRYASVGGQRYDLWRVALKEFESAPVLGVGAQNYAFDYYRERRTNRNLDDPHGLVFSLLSETGAVGALLFALFVAGVVGLLVGGWRRMARPHRCDAVGPLATGAVLLGQSAVDWISRIPGLTAIGIFALAVGAAQVAVASGGGAPAPSARVRPRSRWIRAVVGALTAGLLALAVLGVLSLFVSNAYLQHARELDGRPAAELSAARHASTLEPWSVVAHYVQASAYETMGRRDDAYAQLRAALRLEPESFATLGVLGDFEARGGHLAAARAYYRRALALNPLDVGLQQLARLGERRGSVSGAPRSPR